MRWTYLKKCFVHKTPRQKVDLNARPIYVQPWVLLIKHWRGKKELSKNALTQQVFICQKSPAYDNCNIVSSLHFFQNLAVIFVLIQAISCLFEHFFFDPPFYSFFLP